MLSVKVLLRYVDKTKNTADILFVCVRGDKSSPPGWNRDLITRGTRGQLWPVIVCSVAVSGLRGTLSSKCLLEFGSSGLEQGLIIEILLCSKKKEEKFGDVDDSSLVFKVLSSQTWDVIFFWCDVGQPRVAPCGVARPYFEKQHKPPNQKYRPRYGLRAWELF